jgi:hypothetical protein
VQIGAALVALGAHAQQRQGHRAKEQLGGGEGAGKDRGAIARSTPKSASVLNNI